MLIMTRDLDTSLPLSDVIWGDTKLGCPAITIIFIFIFIIRLLWVESGSLVAIDIFPWK